MPNLYTTGQSNPETGGPKFGPANDNSGIGVVRPTSIPQPGMSTGGPSFDSSYLQNLATSAGGTFMRPDNGVLNFNPLGNLSDIPTNPLGGGNAPLFGLPKTLQQNAQAIAPTPASPTVPTPTTQAPQSPTPARGTPGQIVPNSNNLLVYGPTGVPMLNFAPGGLPQSLQGVALGATAGLGGSNVLASLLSQYGISYNPAGGFFISQPVTGTTGG